MKLKVIKEIFLKELSPAYKQEEIVNFFHLFVEHYLGANRFILVLQPEYRIGKEQEQLFFEGLAHLKEERPVQYILGTTEFMGLTLEVNEQVLIPRPETEELVRWMLDDHATRAKPQTVFDIGTGSGCIAIALAREWPGSRIQAMDISGEALAMARKNALRNQVSVQFLKADIRTWAPQGPRWDVIVSNPPYVRESERGGMSKNVIGYEPAQALFVPDERPTLFYEAISQLARDYLNPGGLLYLEINEGLATDCQALLKEHNFSEIELRKDLFGKDRMLRAQL